MYDVGGGSRLSIQMGALSGFADFFPTLVDNIITVRLATLPTAFDTPMFWNDNDLKELEGTSVVGRFKYFLAHRLHLTHWLLSEKLGKDDAERDYNEKVLPAIQVYISLTFRYSIDKLFLFTRVDRIFFHWKPSRDITRSSNTI